MNTFDTDKMTEFAIKEIQRFSENHQEETFYAFTIDANLLCLNSIEQFEKTLSRYRERWGGYNTDIEIQNLKENIGDWEYQGFVEFNDSVGFNMELYLDHYHAEDEEQIDSDYAVAIDKVIDNLKNSNAFDNLNKTDDFYISRIEHDY